ncbi:MAG: S41 family peptidase [Defluviitaleaceae bacterium]|nr:S41 family peptidase [Defluviitaleaceae bacterium]
MKKLLIALIIIVFALALAACSQAEENAPDRPIFLIREDGEELTREHFLADLDYMMWVLETNFAVFDVAYWARGVDMHSLAADARDRITASEHLDEDIFLGILMDSFLPLFGIAHFAIHDAELNMRYYNNVMGFSLPGWQDVLNMPRVRGFYDPRIQELMETFEMSDMPPGDNMAPSSEIIEEGKTALIRLPSMQLPLVYGLAILDFYEEIRDFEHLILDLRGNPGGFESFFFEIIMGPNIEEVITMDIISFVKAGERVIQTQSLLAGTANIRFFGGLRPIDEVLAENYLPQLNLVDMERMTHGIAGRLTVSPRPEEGFGGKIWMLTDGHISSAAQIAAFASKDTGFATLVGDTTGGNFSGPRLLVSTPNTGILFQFDALYMIDSNGRPLEAGTMPHHFNRDGMDALETVLALIEEGNY